MIDFTLTENDKAQLARTRAEALICRKYAREYEEREELPPDELPERAEFLASAEAVPESGPDDSPKPVMMALHAMGQPGHEARILEAAAWLEAQQDERTGLWAYPDRDVDLSNTQFAVLALKAAALHGYEAPSRLSASTR